MNDFKNSYLFWVLMVGLVAGFLSHAKDERPKSLKQRFIYFVIGAISSTFLCWMTYEIAFYYIAQQNPSLAIGGFFAWRGAEWATAIVDKFIDSKLKNNERSYEE
ncbi:hypothetical protein KDE13_07440 [Campylobacter sp. faydin G-140]|uniref:phage holin family protein n=1 Tax=Campylobacter anatolicus TaxID=2829105 RepID=UPI001B8FF23A|nr:phage holin family protein [Campylobacter anatolicus]MBR8466170.1 hypothetical protein [Campylobacter anatolicus]